MIGLSLSKCIADIIAGNVRIENVEKIYTRTNCLSPYEWKSVIQSYKTKHWASDPERAEKYFRWL